MATVTEFGKFLSVQRSPDTGEIIGYRVRSPKNKIEQYFGIKTHGTLAKALKAAQSFAETNLKNKVLTEANYLEIRNKNTDLTAKNFSKYLNEKTDWVPERGSKFTRDGIKQLDNKLNYKSPFIKLKKEVPENIKTKIYNEYKTQMAKGERNLSEISRKYFPNETRNAQGHIMRNILIEKGEDISQFRKVRGPDFDPAEAKTAKTRKTRLGVGKKAAGLTAGKMSDELLGSIAKLNQDILKMSDAQILANEKIINSMKINTNVNNLNRGIIAFDKYDDLSPKELVKKIKARAKAGIFWQPEHISSVKGQARNIYYPNNLQAAPGNIGAFMENFKKMAAQDPNNPLIRKGGEIDKLLSEYSLTVRDPRTKVRIGFQDVIEVDSINKRSNIISANAASLNKSPTSFRSTLLKAAKTNAGGVCNIFRAEGGRIGFAAGSNCALKMSDALARDPIGVTRQITQLSGNKTINSLKTAAGGFLKTLGRGGARAAPFAALAAVGAGIEPLVKQFVADDPNTYLTNEGQMKGMLLATIEGETPKVDEEILKWQYPGLGAATLAGAVPGARETYLDRLTGRGPAGPAGTKLPAIIAEKPVGKVRAALGIKGVLGKALGASFSPLAAAATLPINIAAQRKGGTEWGDIATDPMNWMAPAFASSGAEMATRGIKNPILLNALRLGMKPSTLRMISSKFGLPGLMVSAGMWGYDKWKNRSINEED